MRMLLCLCCLALLVGEEARIPNPEEAEAEAKTALDRLVLQPDPHGESAAAAAATKERLRAAADRTGDSARMAEMLVLAETIDLLLQYPALRDPAAIAAVRPMLKTLVNQRLTVQREASRLAEIATEARRQQRGLAVAITEGRERTSDHEAEIRRRDREIEARDERIRELSAAIEELRGRLHGLTRDN